VTDAGVSWAAGPGIAIELTVLSAANATAPENPSLI
jgi:hypothetical protein